MVNIIGEMIWYHMNINGEMVNITPDLLNLDFWGGT